MVDYFVNVLDKSGCLILKNDSTKPGTSIRQGGTGNSVTGNTLHNKFHRVYSITFIYFCLLYSIKTPTNGKGSP